MFLLKEMKNKLNHILNIIEVDDYHLQRLRELGLGDDDEDDVNQYISRI